MLFMWSKHTSMLQKAWSKAKTIYISELFKQGHPGNKLAEGRSYDILWLPEVVMTKLHWISVCFIITVDEIVIECSVPDSIYCLCSYKTKLTTTTIDIWPLPLSSQNMINSSMSKRYLPHTFFPVGWYFPLETKKDKTESQWYSISVVHSNCKEGIKLRQHPGLLFYNNQPARYYWHKGTNYARTGIEFPPVLYSVM